ncbi:hypothetical protein [Serratia proteamaculans]
MKLSNISLALAVTLSFAGAAHAATKSDGSVSKKIVLTAQINDGIFVSKPDGSSWYNTEELEASDYKQAHFSKTLPVRVWSKSADFNISLASELKMSSGKYEMLNPKVVIVTNQGDKDVNFGSTTKVTQVTAGEDGFDAVYDLKIDVDAPAKPKAKAGSGESIDGSYSGELVMLFEPVAAVEEP